MTVIRESMYHYQLFLYKISRVLKETLSSQDNKKLFNGAEGIRWSLRLNSERRTNSQDMFHTGPGAAHAWQDEARLTLTGLTEKVSA